MLTDASASGAVDYLTGLKENVIIRRLIPTDPARASLEVMSSDDIVTDPTPAPESPIASPTGVVQ